VSDTAHFLYLQLYGYTAESRAKNSNWIKIGITARDL